MNRPVVLCFVAYYLPGYCSGGPVQTIANLVDQLGDEFDLRIVTRDRDIRDTHAYADVSIDVWNSVGKAQVFYASERTLQLRSIAQFLCETPHDILYLNSYFAFNFTGLPLIARRLGMAPRSPCLIAPRGEFSLGALALKGARKRVYMYLAKTLGLYRNLYWQASSDFEKADITREMGTVARWVYVAPDLAPSVTCDLDKGISRSPGPLRLVFVSRISPIKNLDFLLRVLRMVTAEVELAIYGPQEDVIYWKQCKELIDQLPRNINVTVGGQISQEQVRDVFAAYDLFVFPTRGENFGHVIFESLTAGTPVLVSDRTLWQRDADGGLEALPLNEVFWADAIEVWAKLDHEVLIQRRGAAWEYGSAYAADKLPLEQNRQLFRLVLGEN